MNLKKCFIGVLVTALSLTITIPSKAMFSVGNFALESFTNPITYDDNPLAKEYVPSSRYTLVDSYTGCNTGNVWFLGSGMSPEARTSEGERLYALALEKKDDSEKFECLKNAAYHGNVDALIATGRCYEEGKGVDKDETMAYRYYCKAQDKGSKSVQQDIDRLDKKWKVVSESLLKLSRIEREVCDYSALHKLVKEMETESKGSK